MENRKYFATFADLEIKSVNINLQQLFPDTRAEKIIDFSVWWLDKKSLKTKKLASFKTKIVLFCFDICFKTTLSKQLILTFPRILFSGFFQLKLFTEFNLNSDSFGIPNTHFWQIYCH